MLNLKNSYLGFTDKMTARQKGKVEQMLDKRHRSTDASSMGLTDGIILQDKDFYLYTIIHCGGHLEMLENQWHYKQDGTKTQPKTEYGLTFSVISGDKGFMELTKMAYNFCQYIIDNGFTTEEAVLKFLCLEEDRKRIEEERRQAKEEEEKRIEEERRCIKAEEEEKIRHTMENLPPEERILTQEIYRYYYGQTQLYPHQYKLTAMIHHFDTEYCKDEIIEYLSPDNKASAKIFECMTGLRLPKSWKARTEFINSVTSTDFQGMSKFVPRHRKAAIK